nr:nodulin MtN21 /EamA-like transporter family protein [Tanacetum cinerariifolium]
DLVTKLLNKSRLKYVSYPIFISCALQVLLGSEYTQHKKFRFLPPILSNSNFTKDLSKVIDIELTAYMIVVNNQRDSVSPPLLAITPKKGKSQTVTSTFLKSQGPKASGALFQKSKRPKSKQPPTETIVTLPKPTEGSNMGLPSTLDEGTRKSKPLPESIATHPKDSGGNKQPFDRDITSTTLDEGTTKTTPRPEGSLGDKDSEGNIPPANMEPIHTLVVNPSGTEKESDEEEVLPAGDDMDEDSPDYTETALKRKVSSLRQDTSKIKSMMVEIYQAFKGRPSSALLGSVTPTLALTHIPANVEGENPLTLPLKNLFPTLRERLKTQQWPF